MTVKSWSAVPCKAVMVVVLLLSLVLISSGCSTFTKRVRPDEFSLTMERDFNDDGSSIDRLSAAMTWRLGVDKVEEKPDQDDSARRDKEWDK